MEAKIGRGHDTKSGLRELLWMAGIATCIKVLLIPAYHSTDFEVHRHWLAVTHSLPIKQWYLDETSEWTLDYPPLFAWLEWCLSHAARLVDPRIVDIEGGLNYKSFTVVAFQRASVIVCDGMLFLGLWRCCRSLSLPKQRLIYAAVVWSPGLLMVDHIHFQYNGFLLGILLLSLSFLREGNDLVGGILFAILLCFKHLFAVAAPVYFVYLLRHYCRDFRSFLTLGGSVVTVVLAAFGPFIYYGEIDQLLKRLFPFGRGLCHAYWAPNFWALYNVADKVLSFLLLKMGWHIEVPHAAMTGGLVGDFKPFAVLPQITPMTTMGLVICAMIPCLIQIWKKPQKHDVVRYVAYAYICGFMFGWHVHEKASLHFVIPLSLIAVNSAEDGRNFMFLSTVSYYSLFPLFFEAREYPIKVLLLILQTSLMYLGLSTYYNGCESASSEAPRNTKENGSMHLLLGKSEGLYYLGIFAVEIYGLLVHGLVLRDKLPFLPLLLVSVYCALGLLYVWLWQLFCIWRI